MTAQNVIKDTFSTFIEIMTTSLLFQPEDIFYQIKKIEKKHLMV